MTRNELLKEFQKFTAKMQATMAAKNQDYAGDNVDDDPFFNFSLVEKIGISSTEVGMLTRMSDKLARISNFIKTETVAVKSESVVDTAQDLAVYSILLALYLQDKHGIKTKK